MCGSCEKDINIIWWEVVAGLAEDLDTHIILSCTSIEGKDKVTDIVLMRLV